MGKTKLAEGIYDLLVDQQLDQELQVTPADLVATFGELSEAELADLLTAQMRPILRRALQSRSGQGHGKIVELANEIVRLLVERTTSAGIESTDAFCEPPRRLTSMHRDEPGLATSGPPRRPALPLTTSALLVNGPQDLRIGLELRRELESADRVDLLCAFLKQSGVNIIRNELAAFLARRPGALRILSTTYMGATENNAVRELLDMGADLRISYNNQTTRLHAKAWLFHRDSGFSTAFVGSSNLSAAALLDGLEWNVRISAVENPTILSRFATTFEQYWNDVEFEPYDPERFKLAHQEQSGRSGAEYISGLKVRPYPHQSEILDDLAAEREAGHTRNLVVAATGTGKTVTAALDFKRLWDAHGPLKLLFVAHRQEILKQSRATFRAVMGDPSFGELLVGGKKPNFGDHVFASIQSLHQKELESLPPDTYDVIIVDEFHHAAAPTYERMLHHFTPRYLVGLTATPERADGRSILDWFDDRVAAELRLWKALDRGLLAPFQYFGIGDETDISTVTFRRGGYDRAELEQVLTGDKFRALRVRQAVDRYIAKPLEMRAIGFCVGLHHAALMAQAFIDAGFQACAVAGSPPRENGKVLAPFRDRDEALRDLRDGKLQCIFTVDLFNEGVDVPSIDTVLFLRPTESATVFLQQLGRGLRHSKGKSHLTVLDFIGNANKHYRFDVKFKALTGGTRREVARHIEDEFPYLPPGCEIQLDRQAQEHVLANIRASVGTGELRYLTRELRETADEMGADITLKTYLDALQMEMDELYSRSGRSWTDLRRRAGLEWPDTGDEYEKALLRAMARIQHVDDRERLRAWYEWLSLETPPAMASLDTREGRLQLMLLASVVDRMISEEDLSEGLQRIWDNPAVRRETREILEVQQDRLRRVSFDDLGHQIPLKTHATYSLAEIMAAYGIVRSGNLYAPREGVLWDEATQTDLLFVTVHKDPDEYAPQHMFEDYPLSQDLFHWETQPNTSEASPTGQRYIHHVERGSKVVLFVRQYKKVDGLTQPYLCLGKARYVRHESERPIRIVWALERPMPAWFYQETKTAAG